MVKTSAVAECVGRMLSMPGLSRGSRRTPGWWVVRTRQSTAANSDMKHGCGLTRGLARFQDMEPSCQSATTNLSEPLGIPERPQTKGSAPTTSQAGLRNILGSILCPSSLMPGSPDASRRRVTHQRPPSFVAWAERDGPDRVETAMELKDLVSIRCSCWCVASRCVRQGWDRTSRGGTASGTEEGG